MCFKILFKLPAWALNVWVSFLPWSVLFRVLKQFRRFKIPGSEDADEMKLRADKLKLDRVASQISTSSEILELIFQNSDFEHLKKCRLVCKTWNREICQTCSKSLWIARLDVGKMGKFRAEFESRDVSLPVPYGGISLQASSDITREEILWLTSNLEIIELDMIYFDGVGDYDAQFLLHTCSPTLTYLYTEWCDTWDESLPMNFPRLQVLHAHTSSSLAADEAGAEQAQCFVRLISSAPQLSHLSIGGRGLAVEILKNANLKRVRELEISMCEGMSIWDSLEQVEIENLVHLNVYNCAIAENEDYLDRGEQTLARYSASLKSVKIGMSRGFKHGGHPSRFPLCPYLTYLELDLYNPEKLDLSGLPALKHLTFWSIIASSSESVSGVYSSSVRNIVFKERIVKYVNVKVMSHEREDTFLSLFRRFPNAKNWNIRHRYVINFTRAAEAVGFKVQGLTIVVKSRKDDDEEDIVLHDRHLFSYVVRLKDLEFLGLYNCTKSHWKRIRVKEWDFGRLYNLKVLQNRSNPGSTFEDYIDLPKDLKLVVTGPRNFNGAEGILARENVDFAPYSKKFVCFCSAWNPSGLR